MKQISYLKVGKREKNARIWIEGKRLAACGFDHGQAYVVVLDIRNRRLTLKPETNGDKVVSGRKDRASGKVLPIIDLCNADITNHIQRYIGAATRVRVDFECRKISISLHEVVKNTERRESWLRKHIQKREVTKGVVCAGGCISTWGTAEGLHDAGYQTRLAWILDREGKYLQSAIDNVPVVNDGTRIFEATVEEINPSLLRPVDILSVSLPCVGFSRSGISKKHLSCPEADDSATAFIGLLGIVRSVNPSVIVHENVPSFANSATYLVLKSFLAKIGYVVSERILGKEMGAFENRNRHIMVAISRGVASYFDMDAVRPSMTAASRLAELLEDIPGDSPRWKTYSYLAEKETRDIAAGKGFRRQLLDEEATEVGVLGRGYNKVRSTEPQVLHPTDPSRSRLLTPAEHARVKGIPEQAVAGLSDTIAHEILGQSVLFPVFKSLGRFLGAGFDALRQEQAATVAA